MAPHGVKTHDTMSGGRNGAGRSDGHSMAGSVPTCYFKSTDGHSGNWSFSTTRVNFHVALMAAEKGGVLIVDATRKGKVRRRLDALQFIISIQLALAGSLSSTTHTRSPCANKSHTLTLCQHITHADTLCRNCPLQRFTDAFSKTVPIWASVMNRAVAVVRKEHGGKQGDGNYLSSPSSMSSLPSSPEALIGPGVIVEKDKGLGEVPVVGDVPSPSGLNRSGVAALDWDTSLHLPLWISANEARQIESRLDAWVEDLISCVGIDQIWKLAQVWGAAAE